MGRGVMAWQYERELAYCVSENWSGWLCERCCWNRPTQQLSPVERNALAAVVEKEFASHDCEAFSGRYRIHREQLREPQ